MKTILNAVDARLWLLLVCVLALYCLLLNHKLDAAQMQNDLANVAAQKQYQTAVLASIDQERALRAEFDQQATQFRKERRDEQIKNDRTITALRNGTVRVSIPVTACHPATAVTDTATTSRNPITRAELTPEAGATLAAIAAEGDAAIHDLNACIGAYNTVRDKINAAH